MNEFSKTDHSEKKDSRLTPFRRISVIRFAPVVSAEGCVGDFSTFSINTPVCREVSPCSSGSVSAPSPSTKANSVLPLIKNTQRKKTKTPSPTPQKRLHDYNLRIRKKPNGRQSPEDSDSETEKMRPYKKRSFYSTLQSNENSMETENSDDCEKLVSPPPAIEGTEKEKDTDKERIVKNRKQWKRKISRKQFRHHDIKVFTPGEFRSNVSIRRQKDSSPTLLKKTDVASKESITESIVNSLLGGQKQNSLTQQTSVRVGDPVDVNNSKTDVEENNNTNSTQNHNSAGKHHLPAIIMENPTVRRRSLESNSTAKPSFAKNPDQPNTKTLNKERPFNSRTAGDMPSLHHSDTIAENDDQRSPKTNHQTDNSRKTAAPAQSPLMDQNSNCVNYASCRLTTPEASSTTTMVASSTTTQNTGRPIEDSRVEIGSHDAIIAEKLVTNLGQVRQITNPIDTDYSIEEQPENLSLKRRNYTEAPVDLSKKSSTAQIQPARSTHHHFQNDNRQAPYSSSNRTNGDVEASIVEALSRGPPSYFKHANSEVKRQVARNIFEEAATIQNDKKRTIDYAHRNGPRTTERPPVQIMHNEDRYSPQISSLGTTKPPPPLPPAYPKEYHPPRTESQSISPSLIGEAMAKIRNLNTLREMLKHLMQQRHFNTQVLELMSHTYRELEVLQEQPCIPAELKVKAQYNLAETYNFISVKLKHQFGLDWNPIDVIKILGQSEPNIEKHTLQNNLEEIQRMRNLNLNGFTPPNVPTSVGPFMLIPNNHLNYGELHKNPYNMPNSFTRAQHHTAEPPVSRVASPRISDIISSRVHADILRAPPLEVSNPPMPQRFPRIVNAKPNSPTAPLHPPAGHPTMRPGYQRELSLRLPPNPYLNYPPAVNDTERKSFLNQPMPKEIPVSRSYNPTVGRPRSKSHKPADAMAGNSQLKRSLSHPNAAAPLVFPYMDSSRVPQVRIPTSQNAYHLPPTSTMPQNNLQNNDLRITALNGHQKPPIYSEVYHQTLLSQMAKEQQNNYRNTYTDVTKTTLPNIHGLVLSESQRPISVSSRTLSPKVQESRHTSSIAKRPIVNHILDSKISSTTDHLEVSKIRAIPRQSVYEENNLMGSITSKTKEGVPKAIPAVIVADRSMQITKEPTQASNLTDMAEEKDTRMSVITSSSENASSPEENSRQDQDENNSEILGWVEKLESNKELKSKFLSLIKKEKQSSFPSGVCIEIVDSDEEKPVITKIEPADTDIEEVSAAAITFVPRGSSPAAELADRQAVMAFQKSTPQPPLNTSISFQGKLVPGVTTTITVPCTLEITPVPPLSEVPKPLTTPLPKQSLSNSGFIPPIALPYVPTNSAVAKECQFNTTEQKKTIYSPEIEPISPVGNEPSFAFPVLSPVSKTAAPSPESLPKNVDRRVTSPNYIQKRKTPVGFTDYHRDDSVGNNRKPTEYSSDNGPKKRKSIDRPQTAMSPRVVPSGKLCYVRERHMFLRYFDDTQVALFIKNLSFQDEELLRTTGIDPEKIKSCYKQSNFGVEQLGKTEEVHLPSDIEFSRKEDLQDVEEFVKESNLVERFVPKDFADFYRYVTGFQIIKNKHPVSLQTFLLMYNTNGTTELLRKYLQRRDEDSFGAIIR